MQTKFWLENLKGKKPPWWTWT